MLKLYGEPPSRAAIVHWYIEELGIPFEYVTVKTEAEDQRKPAFLAINPMGKVPAITDGDFTLWESGAILLYLAEKHGQLPESMEARATLNQWLYFANSTLGFGLFFEEQRAREMPRLLAPLNDILGKQPFVIGEQFTVADVALGATLAFVQTLLQLDMSAYPAILQYIQRISERPAFQKAMGGAG